MAPRESGDFLQQLGSLGSSLVTYVKSRDAEHWLFFAIGVIVGIAIS
jgi:hypothetical protein